MPTQEKDQIKIVYEGETYSLDKMSTNNTIADYVLEIPDGHQKIKSLSKFFGKLPLRELTNLFGNKYLVPLEVEKYLRHKERLIRTNIELNDETYEAGNVNYVVKNTLIVFLRSEADISSLKKLLVEKGGKIIDMIDFAPIYLVEFDNFEVNKQNYRELLKLDFEWIKALDINYTSYDNNRNLLDTRISDPSIWNFEFSEQVAYKKIALKDGCNRKYFGDGKIRVGVFDVGIDNDHKDLFDSKNNQIGYDFYCECNEDAIPDRDYSHGTNCAGLIAGNADGISGVEGVGKNCTIADYRIGVIENRKEELQAELFEIIRAFYIAAFEDKIDIINCSWGYDVPLSTLAETIKDVVKRGRNCKGVVVVAAAGNSGKSNVRFPAKMDEVIGVTGVDEKNTPIFDARIYGWKSNYGDGADIAAPSHNLVTTSNRSPHGEDRMNYNYNFFGTSAAAPIVSGTAVLILSKHNYLTALDVKEIITDSMNVTLFPKKNEYNCYGAGVINIEKIFSNIV